MKGLIALRQSTDAFRLKSLQDIKDRVQLITVPGQNGVEKEDVVIGYQITAPNGDIYAVFVNADEKAREFTLGSEFAHLRNAQVLADENQAGTLAIAKPQGLAWTENGLKLNALTATVLRITKESPALPSTQEKPEVQPSTPKTNTDKPEAKGQTLANKTDATNSQTLANKTDATQPGTDSLSQKVLPNTGTEKVSYLALAGISLLALLGLGSFLKSRKEQ